MDNKDGSYPLVLPLSTLISAREDVEDGFQVSSSRLELLRAPRVARLRIAVLELFVDRR